MWGLDIVYTSTDQKLHFSTFRESVSLQNMNIGDKNGQDENGSQVT